LSEGTIGLFFVVAAGTRIVSGQVCAYIVNKYNGIGLPLVILSFLVASVAYLMSGPMYTINAKPTILLEVVRQIVFGVSLGPITAVTYTQAFIALRENEATNNLAASSAFASLTTIAGASG
jgi:hypothetical protein